MNYSSNLQIILNWHYKSKKESICVDQRKGIFEPDNKVVAGHKINLKFPAEEHSFAAVKGIDPENLWGAYHDRWLIIRMVNHRHLSL